MVVFCEECGKKYRIDDSMIVGKTARCKCMSCGNIIEVTKRGGQARMDPAPSGASPYVAAAQATTQAGEGPAQGQTMKQKAAPRASRKSATHGVGLSIGATLLISFLGYVVLLGAVLAFAYMKYVPELMLGQVDLRTAAISQSLSTAVSQPLLLRNYFRINKTAEAISKLPGVAYVAVLNKKGKVVAGIFGDLQRFSPDFSAKVKETGFPKEVVAQNPIKAGEKTSSKVFVLGGKKIHDVAKIIEGPGGVVHVGLFAEDAEKAVSNSLKPLLFILVAMVVLGCVSFMLLARTISTPIKSLTDAAHRISLGELDLPIDINKGGEIGELAASLERMRFSIKSAIERLRRR
ncbi:methyl-accepting chemotaxis protein McpB [bacterium BMS3Bbin14]|nr:methyl-accepting chemotaxis protein McpB [bacterium BMS3Bbin14]